MTRKVLYLLRHADAESSAGRGRGDADRPLSARGVAQAQNVGAWLTAREPVVEQVIRSDALRTAETLAQLNLSVPVEINERLYRAGASTICDAVSGIDPACGCVLVIGHAPGVPAAVHALVDRSTSDPVALELVDVVYGTATVSRLEFDGEWIDLAAQPEDFASLTAAYRG